MDPLSISASIIALLQLSSTVIGYLNDIKGGPNEKQKIRLEICNVLPMLSILQDQAEQAKKGDPWSSTLLSLDVPEGPIQQFRTALERLEVRLAPRGGLKKVGKVFTWPFEKDEIQRILFTIERQKLLFTLARQNDHIALAKAIKGNVEAVHKRVNEIGEGMAKLQVSEKHHKIRLWLDGPDPSSNYNTALRKRCGGTGAWLIENAVFRDWKQDPGPGSFIWLYGIPGCGKTILCSTILEGVLHNYAPASNIAVLYFFFDFNDPDKQLHEGMIRSLLSQLSMHCVSVPPVLETLYSSCMNGGRKPTFEALLEIFHQMAIIFENIFIVLDALDECKEGPEMLADIEELISWKDTNLRILATSRREKDIEDSILHLTKDESRICIQNALVNADIRTYVHDQLQKNKKLRRWQKEPEVQMEIEDTLMKKANGMFRWAACQLDSLESCLTLPKLRKVLAILPRTLNDTYARILCSIDEEYQQEALHILQWLAFSERPLRLEEISEVLAIDVNDTPRFDAQRRLPDPRDVVEICSSLITVTPRSSYDAKLGRKLPETFVSLAHFSVKEYLISEVIRQGQAAKYSLEEIDCHVSLAKDCLAYLLHFDMVGSLQSEVFVEYPLARYAARNWIKHARLAEKKDNTLCQDFFLTKGEAFFNWVRLDDLDRPSKSDLARLSETIASPLYYASVAHLLESVRMLLDKGADINARGGKYGSALIAASDRGYIEIVRLLLEKGACVETASSFYGNALRSASDRGHSKIVQLLLDKGADINALGGSSETVLIAASRRGYIEIVQLLLEKDAHLDFEGSFYGTALQTATDSGHIEIVQTLLEKGADVNARRKFRPENALLAAIGNRNEELAQLLIEHGADVTGRDRALQSPLESASYEGLQRVVELMLDKDVLDEVQGEKHSRALAKASRGGQPKIVQILLGKGAIINAQVMEAALHGGSTEVLQMLFNHGSDPSDLSLLDAEGRALCHHASAQNSVTRLKMLLKFGSDLTVTDKQGRTCLHHAATTEGSKISAVTWLLKEGFDPNLPDRDGWTPLHWAAKAGNAEIIEILEDAGAKFSFENIVGWTPDVVAVFHHHKVSWKSNTAMAYGAERSKSTLEDGTSSASLEADARISRGQIFSSEYRALVNCHSCNLEICGTRHECWTCYQSGKSFDYCFKCKQSSNDTHPGHTFSLRRRY